MELRRQSLKISPLGDSVVLIQWESKIDEETLRDVLSVDKELNTSKIIGVIETVPAYQSLAIHYNFHEISFEKIKEYVLACREKQNDSESALRNNQLVEIPVCYNAEFGPDLNFVLEKTNTTFDAFVRIHSEPDYLVFMKGFLPGFTYLGGLHESLAMDRKSNPRIAIPRGSVAIGGNQTGIYGIDSPGGWNIVGRTPLSMFNVKKQPVSPISPGDKVRFISITEKQYVEIKREVDLDSYQLKYIDSN